MREPIGSIPCPWCKRQAELHESEERPKLNPDGGGAKGSYPKKRFVVCPPTTGYRGCGTTLANSALAQAAMIEQATIAGKAPLGGEPLKPVPKPTAAPPPKPAEPPKKKPFEWF